MTLPNQPPSQPSPSDPANGGRVQDSPPTDPSGEYTPLPPAPPPVEMHPVYPAGRVQDFPPVHPRGDAELQQAIAELRRELAQQREINRGLAQRLDNQRDRIDDLAAAASGSEDHSERHDDLAKDVFEQRERIERLERWKAGHTEANGTTAAIVGEMSARLSHLQEVAEALARGETAPGGTSVERLDNPSIGPRMVTVETELAAAKQRMNKQRDKIAEVHARVESLTGGEDKLALEPWAALAARIEEVERAAEAHDTAHADNRIAADAANSGNHDRYARLEQRLKVLEQGGGAFQSAFEDRQILKQFIEEQRDRIDALERHDSVAASDEDRRADPHVGQHASVSNRLAEYSVRLDALERQVGDRPDSVVNRLDYHAARLSALGNAIDELQEATLEEARDPEGAVATPEDASLESRLRSLARRIEAREQEQGTVANHTAMLDTLAERTTALEVKVGGGRAASINERLSALEQADDNTPIAALRAEFTEHRKTDDHPKGSWEMSVQDALDNHLGRLNAHRDDLQRFARRITDLEEAVTAPPAGEGRGMWVRISDRPGEIEAADGPSVLYHPGGYNSPQWMSIRDCDHDCDGPAVTELADAPPNAAAAAKALPLDWRDVGPDFRARVHGRVQRRLAGRLDDGLREYGHSFSANDPLAEAEDELLDALIYIAVARQKFE